MIRDSSIEPRSKTQRVGLRTLASAFVTVSLISVSQAQNEGDKRRTDEIEAVRSSIEQWVRLTQDTATLRADWGYEKELLENTKGLLEDDVKQLKSSIEEAKKDEASVEASSLEQSQKRTELENASQALKGSLDQIEIRLVKLIKRFPPYLLQDDSLASVLEALNNEEKRKELSLSDRVTNLVTLLTKSEEAHREIRAVQEPRPIGDGKVQNVDVVYIGLTVAYAVNKDRDRAWIAYPGENGWDFEEKSGLGKEIGKIVRIARNEGDIEFVNLPLTIQD